MGQVALREEAAAAVDQRLATIRASAEQRVIDLGVVRARQQQRERERVWRRARRNRRRAGQIHTGIKALCAVGQMPEFQALMTLSGGALRIWGDDLLLPASKDAGRFERIVSLNLYPEYLRICDLVYFGESQDPVADESMDVCISYETGDICRTSRWLNELIVITPMIDFNDHELMQMKDAFDSRAVLWQIVAECANPKRLEDYVRHII